MNQFFWSMLPSNSSQNIQSKMANSFNFKLPTSNKGLINLDLEIGQSLFVLGANGAGKSTLMHRIYSQFPNESIRLLAHRQTWFPENSISITATQKKQNEINIKNRDIEITSRFKDDYSSYRSSLTFFNLLNKENEINAEVTKLLRQERIDEAKALSLISSPVEEINELFKISNIPIKITKGTNQDLFAQKNNGEKYSIAELSDGERNALLISADILTAPKNKLIILDEPEKHLHRSIISPLLSSLFLKRQDLAFVISTHDVNLPLDYKKCNILLIRDCTWNGKYVNNWDADLLLESDNIPFKTKEGILGSKRNILFIEGNSQSLDRQIYELIYPNLTIIPKGSCSEVIRSVEGIKATDNVHWLNAYGLIDADDRTDEQIQNLAKKGIISLSSYSVEYLYYNLEIISRVATRYADMTGENRDLLLEKAKSKIIENMAIHKDKLCSILCGKKIRNSIMLKLPTHQEILSGSTFQLEFNTGIILQEEKDKFDNLVKSNNIDMLISRYPIKKTGVKKAIASGLGISIEKYEKTVRKLILDDENTLNFYKNDILSNLTNII